MPSASKIIPAYEAIAEILVQAEVEGIFGVLGEDTGPIVVAAAALGISYYPARHENLAVAMADAYSRATGRIGVVALTGGPGFTNAITALYTAHRAGSRMLVLVGTGRTEEDDHSVPVIATANGPSWLKYFPQSAVLDAMGIPVVKPIIAATAVLDTNRALGLAQQATTVLILGRTLLTERVETVSALSPVTVVLNEAGVDEPDPVAISELADFLQESWAVKQPLVLAGRGAVEAGAGPALKELAAIVGGLLATTLRGRGIFQGEDYALGVCGSFSTPIGAELISQSDCVLAFGASLNPWTTYRNSLFPKALLVQVDRDPAAIGKFLPAGVGIHGDARAVAQALVDELHRRGHRSDGCRGDRVRSAIAAHRDEDGFSDKSTDDQVDPRSLMLALSRMLPQDRILCVDAGQQARFAIRYIKTPGPRDLLYSTDFGALGLGLGIAAGAAIAQPNRLVVAAVGDGGAMMSLGDLETLVRLQLPVLVVISNDGAYGAEVNALEAMGLNSTLAHTPAPSFEAMAVAMGARAATIRKIEELDVVEHWLKNPLDMPMLLDFQINPAVRTE